MRSIAIDKSLLKSLLVLASVIEARDAFTGGHIWRTSRYARTLAAKLGLTPGDVFVAELGGLIHDIGKIAIPDSILNKRDRLTQEEYQLVKTHPDVGMQIVSNHPLSPLVEYAIAQHHVRMDGKGYPERYADKKPALVARIISISDAFDAITSMRPYRGKIDLERAIGILESEKSTQFDAGFTDVFLALARSGALDHILGHCSDDGWMLQCPECGPVIEGPRSAADGDRIDCPSCLGEFALHASHDTFELEWTGARRNVRIPRPDLDTVAEVLDRTPKNLDLDSE
jgi:putative nucleotidyltransferase with HDIG domain